MSGFLSFAQENPAMLVVPAIGFLASLWLVRIKMRYLSKGVLFGRAAPTTDNPAVDDKDASPSGSGARAEQPETPASLAIPAFGGQLWFVVFEGLLARYGGLAKSVRQSQSQTESGQIEPALAKAAAASVAQITEDWQVAKQTMGKTAEARFHFEVHILDQIVFGDMHASDLREQSHLEQRAATAIIDFVDVLRRLQTEAARAPQRWVEPPQHAGDTKRSSA
ncbi:hypothetical protein PQR67_34095 [Paraburkholderia fungorum]|uniref:hypothetical protein n=1 Tax=Paraburkholderia fungorum TaxID=134537 RepID=UPI0038B77764